MVPRPGYTGLPGRKNTVAGSGPKIPSTAEKAKVKKTKENGK